MRGGGRRRYTLSQLAALQELMASDPMTVSQESFTLVDHGLLPVRIHANLPPAALVECALRRGEGVLTDHGAFTATTAPHTGRSPKDKFIIEEPAQADRIWVERNPRLDPDPFHPLPEEDRRA